MASLQGATSFRTARAQCGQRLPHASHRLPPFSRSKAGCMRRSSFRGSLLHVHRSPTRPCCAAASLATAASPAAAAAAPPLVVLTRELGKNEKLRNALESQGVPCFELPLIEHRPGPDFARLGQILREPPSDLGWVAITSPEAASVFLNSWRESGCPQVRVAVVGGGTAEAFQGLPAAEAEALSVGFIPSKAIGSALAAELPLEDGRARVLYPASAKASTVLESGLRERGFEVTRLNTYSTETATSVDGEALKLAAQAPVATFASPTAVRAWSDLVVPLGWSGAAACIGETSATACRKAGYARVFFPDKPGIEGWTASVMEALQESQRPVAMP